MHWSGVNDPEIMLIVEYLGDTLEEKLQKCGGVFSLKTTCMLGLRILQLLRNYHDKGFIHRNINPASLQFGRGAKSLQLFFNDLIDSKRYRNKKSYSHFAYKENVKYTFTNEFASNDFRCGKEVSRKDDIESTILLLGYFLTGVLPQQKSQLAEGRYPNCIE